MFGEFNYAFIDWGTDESTYPSLWINRRQNRATLNSFCWMSEADFGRPNDSRPTIPSSTVSCRSSSTSELEAFNSILSVEEHIRTGGQAPMMVASSSNWKASHFVARFAIDPQGPIVYRAAAIARQNQNASHQAPSAHAHPPVDPSHPSHLWFRSLQLPQKSVPINLRLYPASGRKHFTTFIPSDGMKMPPPIIWWMGHCSDKSCCIRSTSKSLSCMVTLWSNIFVCKIPFVLFDTR